MFKINHLKLPAYRSLIYSALEQLSQQWEALPTVSESEMKQMGAFAREIATWVCHKNQKFLLSELDSFILENPREVSPTLKEQIISMLNYKFSH